MGMFDTFRGKVKCPECGVIHEFESQTKSYECMLESLMLGDYIDRANKNYLYPFDTCCSCENKYNANVVVKRGQIVNFLNDNEIKDIDFDKIENIEECLGRRLEYDERCEKALGCDDADLYDECPVEIGSELTILRDKWTVLDIFKEIRVENESSDRMKMLYDSWYRDNFIYRVKNNKGIIRILAVRHDRETMIYFDDLNDIEKGYDKDNPNKFTIQYGCKLEKLSH